MAWDIRPYDGVGPLAFGQNFEKVQDLIGREGEIFPEGESFRYFCGPDKPITIFDDYLLSEVSFSAWQLEDITLGSANLSVLSDAQLVSLLGEIEDGPLYECYGFILFLKLGISLSGFHDGDEDQKAITVFGKGHWDEFKAEMKLTSL